MLSIPPLSAQTVDKIRITNGEWPPLFSESLEGYGLPSRIVTAAFDLEGIKVEYKFFPWKRSYELSRQGLWDGAIGWPYDTDRAESHYYSQNPIDNGSWVFFHLEDTKFTSKTIESLKEFTFGVTIGDWASDGDDIYSKALRDGTFKLGQAATDEQMFKMLLLGRIDIFPQHYEVGRYQLNRMLRDGLITQDQANSIVHVKKPYRKMPLYLLLSKKIPRNKKMITLFDKAMEKMKLDKTKVDTFGLLFKN